MAEHVALTTPETKPSNPRYEIVSVTEQWQLGSIEIRLRGANGETRTCVYDANGLTRSNGTTNTSAPTGLTLMRQQNTANFSGVSRQRRIFERLIADGEFAGAVAGTPD